MKNIVLYHDGSSDDYIALCLIISMLPKRNAKLAAVLISGTGEVNASHGLQNTADICKVLGISEVLLAQGEEEQFSPKRGENFPEYIRSFTNTLPSQIGLSRHTNPNDQGSAVDCLHNIVRESDEPVLVIATGPLTDLALLFEKYPQDREKIEIVIMGGAVQTAGNIKDLDHVSDNAVAEWNIFADISAAKKVIESGVSLLMVPLDVTRHIPLTEKFYNTLANTAQQNPKNALSLVYHLLRILKETFERESPESNFFNVYYLWDPFAALVALEETFAKIEERYIQVDPWTGQTKEVAEGHGGGKIRVAMGIRQSSDRILDYLIETIGTLSLVSDKPENDYSSLKNAAVILSDEQLEIIWKSALENKEDFNKFRGFFSRGLDQGIQNILKDKHFVRELLFSAAKKGDFDKFQHYFVMDAGGANQDKNGKTLLYVVIKNDLQSGNDPATIGRQKIARFLLDNDADMDQVSVGLFEVEPSPWELRENNLKYSNSESLRDRIYSTFFSLPQYGKNIFPILEEYRQKIGQKEPISNSNEFDW